jgi:hypothetical protein
MADAVIAASLVALSISALVLGRDTLLKWCIAGYVALFIVLNPQVSDSWENFARVLLPLGVLCVLSLVPSAPAPVRASVAGDAGEAGEAVAAV